MSSEEDEGVISEEENISADEEEDSGEDEIESEDDEEEEEKSDDEDIVSDDEDEDGEDDDIQDTYFKGMGKDDDDDEDVLSSDEEEIDEEERNQILAELDETISDLCEEVQECYEDEDWSKYILSFEKLIRSAEEYKSKSSEVPKIFVKYFSDWLDGCNKKVSDVQRVYLKKISTTNRKAFNKILKMNRKFKREYDKQIKMYRKSPKGFLEGMEYQSDSDSDIDTTVPEWWKIFTDDESEVKKKGSKKKNKVQDPKKEKKDVVIQERIKTHWDDDKIRDELENMGITSTNKKYIQDLEDMLLMTKNDILRHRIYMQLINIRVNMHNIHWDKCCQELCEVLKLTFKHPEYQFYNPQSKPKKIDPTFAVPLICEYHLFVDTLAKEFTKILQEADPYSLDYVNKLHMEELLLNICENAFLYYDSNGRKKEGSLVLMSILFLLHARKEEDYTVLLKKSQERLDKIKTIEGEIKKIKEMEKTTKIEEEGEEKKKKKKIPNIDDIEFGFLCVPTKERIFKPQFFEVMKFFYDYINKNCQVENDRIKSTLYRVYHLAINSKYIEARDLLLGSGLQERVIDPRVDVQSKILFNRTTTVLGLSAFYGGFFDDCCTILHDIYVSSHKKELISQSIIINPKTKTIEKDKLIPFHMSITLDSLDSCFLVTLILSEVPSSLLLPQATADPRSAKLFYFGNRKRSKAFKAFIKYYGRQLFAGRTGSSKDLIFNAIIAMKNSEWKKAYDQIKELSVVKKLSEENQAKLLEEIKKSCLQTYVIKNVQFQNLKVKELEQIFETKFVQKYLKIMILDSKINAKLDKNEGDLILRIGRKTRKNKWFKYCLLYDRAINLGDYFFLESVATKKNFD